MGGCLFFVAVPLLAALFDHFHWEAAAWITIGVWLMGCFLMISQPEPPNSGYDGE